MIGIQLQENVSDALQADNERFAAVFLKLASSAVLVKNIFGLGRCVEDLRAHPFF